jgi:vacuolar-type H+-ATPase subunit I/STV1
MPTGYTAGILDGSTPDFKTFALECSRAFGASMHMRDEPMGIPYKQQVPSDYHKEKIADAEASLAELASMSDKALINTEREQLTASRIQYVKSQEEQIEKSAKLKAFLSEAENFKSPTPEHVGLRDFMIQQLKDTIKWDGESTFYLEKIAEIDQSLIILNATEIRLKRQKSINWDLDYHLENYRKEVKRCQEANEWMQKLVQAF